MIWITTVKNHVTLINNIFFITNKRVIPLSVTCEGKYIDAYRVNILPSRTSNSREV